MTRIALIGAAFAAISVTPAFAQPASGPDAGPIGRAQMQQMVQQRFAQMDVNHDGFVSPEEMTAGGGDPQRAATMLRRFDSNHDGKISLDELMTARMAMFDAADTNHDGLLSPEERQAAMARLRQPAPEPPQGH